MKLLDSIRMKCQDLFSMKNKKKYTLKMRPASRD